MERRRMGRTGFDTSVLVMGAASLGEVDQATADEAVSAALAAGINHVDVAASYGDAEDRLKPWAADLLRDGVFLATKTGERQADAAWAQINRSMERMGVDHVDLLQVHAVGELDDLDRAMADDGAITAVLRARDEGLTRFVGITGHGERAPQTHLEALRRYDFDALLTPWNPVLASDPVFAAAFAEVVEHCTSRDVALRTIKAVSRRNWPDGTNRGHYVTWYEPYDDPEHLAACLAFVLAQPGVQALATPGDVRLQPLVLAAYERARTMTPSEVDAVMSTDPLYSSPFVAIPI